MTTIYYRGTEIIKMANPIFAILPMSEVIKLKDEYSDDFIYISRGGRNAIENGLTPDLYGNFNPNTEWHHFFVKKEDGSFEAEKINFIK